jgi:acetyl-CoA carboxylase carboxyltransferase component
MSVLDELEARREQARLGGGVQRIENQHKKGQTDSPRAPVRAAR